MVISCWVNGCTNRRDGSVQRGFFSIPKIRHNEGEHTRKISEERRRLWLAKINRKEEPSQHSKICSDHFVNGNPSALYDRANPDWAPTLKLSAKLTPRKSERKLQQSTYSFNRYNRVVERQRTREKHNAAKALIDLFTESGPSVHVDDGDLPDVEPRPVCEFTLQGTIDTSSGATDTCVDPLRNSQVDSEIQRLLTENMTLREQVKDTKYSEEGFIGHDDKVRYDTGLPGFTTLMALFHFVKDFIPKPRSNVELGPFTRLVMTLMRVKLNLPIQDLAYRFQTSPSTVSRTFFNCYTCVICET